MKKGLGLYGKERFKKAFIEMVKRIWDRLRFGYISTVSKA
jgi:hypothetical protein